jgi:hypothetical protein
MSAKQWTAIEKLFYMAQFSRRIRVKKWKLEFVFTEIREQGSVRFFVTLLDENDKFHCFNMKQDEKVQWKILETGKVPSWVLEIEGDLSKTIKRL